MNHSKLFVLTISLLLLLGCSPEFETAAPAKSGSENFDVVCIDGVEYIFFAKDTSSFGSLGWLAPHFKPDGSLYICKMGD